MLAQDIGSTASAISDAVKDRDDWSFAGVVLVAAALGFGYVLFKLFQYLMDRDAKADAAEFERYQATNDFLQKLSQTNAEQLAITADAIGRIATSLETVADELRSQTASAAAIKRTQFADRQAVAEALIAISDYLETEDKAAALRIRRIHDRLIPFSGNFPSHA